MVAIRSSANPYRVYREKNSRVVNLWSHGVGLRQRLGGETQERTASNGERESREQRTENREHRTGTENVNGNGGRGWMTGYWK